MHISTDWTKATEARNARTRINFILEINRSKKSLGEEFQKKELEIWLLSHIATLRDSHVIFFGFCEVITEDLHENPPARDNRVLETQLWILSR